MAYSSAATAAMPLQLRVPNKRTRPLRPLRRTLPRRLAEHLRHPDAAAPATACAILFAMFAASCVLAAHCLAPPPPPPPPPPSSDHARGSHPDQIGPLVRSWALARIDGSALLLLLVMGTAVATCVRGWRRAAACCAAACAAYALGKGFAVLGLGDELYQTTAGPDEGACPDCCTWVYCPCLKWWWLVAQGCAMAVAAALQLVALHRRGRATSIALSDLAAEFIVG